MKFKKYLIENLNAFKKKIKTLIFRAKDERSIKEILKDHSYLNIPNKLWKTPDVMLSDICNGCGAAGKFDFVPDTMWGLNVSPACFVHDFRYDQGRTEKDKKKADEDFLINTILIIDNDPKAWRITKALRRIRAVNYYTAVCEKGHDAFWAGK